MRRVELLDNEEVVVDGPAQFQQDTFDRKVRLSLTNQRVILRVEDNDEMKQLTFCTLNQIEQVKIYKRLRFLKRGINIIVQGENNNFELDYPDDWKKLIELQIKLFEKSSSKN